MSSPVGSVAPGPVRAADDLLEDVRGLDRAGLARCAAAVASLGAGLVAVGVVGPFLRGQASPLAAPAASAVVALALWQLGWAVQALRAAVLPAPGPALVIPVAATAGWVLTAPSLAAGAHTGRGAAVLAAVLTAGVALAALATSRWERSASGTPLRPVVQIAVLLVIALTVASLVTPALAASPAGDGARGMPGMSGM